MLSEAIFNKSFPLSMMLVTFPHCFLSHWKMLNNHWKTYEAFFVLLKLEILLHGQIWH